MTFARTLEPFRGAADRPVVDRARELKVVFLDFDGVILPIRENDRAISGIPSPDAVNNLNMLLQLTRASVVVSSNWRLSHTLGELRDLLKTWGFRGVVIDKTADSADSDRGMEILDWLEENSVERFVVLDDDQTDLEELARNLVRPQPATGLQFHDVQEALRILS